MLKHLSLLLTLTLVPLFAAEDQTLIIKEKPFQILRSYKALIEPQNPTVIQLKSKIWKNFKVKNHVIHGMKVKKGETILQFDDEALKVKIQRESLKLEQLKIEKSLLSSEFSYSQNKWKLEVDKLERELKEAQEDLKYFKEEGKKEKIVSSKFSVTDYENSLAYYKEELRQLEKMYREDDLTEETEEIILRRHRDSVTEAKRNLASAKAKSNEFLKIELPRLEKTLKRAILDKEFVLKKRKLEGPVEINKIKQQLALKEIELKEKERELGELKHDLTLMKVVSPIDGVVYHGVFANHAWSKTDIFEHAQKGVPFKGNETLLSVFDRKFYVLNLKVDERDEKLIHQDKNGIGIPVMSPNKRYRLSTMSKSMAPVESGQYTSTVSLVGDEDLVAGNYMKATFLLYENDKAITIPEQALLMNGKSKQHEVRVLLKGAIKRQTVEVGLSEKGLVEIREGLKSGDKILYPKPRK